MHRRQKCQLGSAPTTGQFCYCWFFERIKPTPFSCMLRMVHRTDAISSPHSAQLYWIFITTQRFYKLHFYPSSLASFPVTPISKITSYPEPAALDGLGNLCSWPWGQLSHIHFPPLCEKPFRASTSPVAAGWVRLWVAGGWAHHLSHCPAHSSSCWTVTCWVKSEFSSNIILQLFLPWEILSIASLNAFHLCLEIWLCWFLTLQ